MKLILDKETLIEMLLCAELRAHEATCEGYFVSDTRESALEVINDFASDGYIIATNAADNVDYIEIINLLENMLVLQGRISPLQWRQIKKILHSNKEF